MMKLILFLALFCPYISSVFGQPVNYSVASTRTYVHYKLDKEQKDFLGIDGKLDDVIRVGNNEEVNLQLTYAATLKIDALQKQIELDTTLDNTQKTTYLRGLGEFLVYFRETNKARKLKIVDFPESLRAWEDAYLLDKQGKSIVGLVPQYPYAMGNLLLRGISFMHNPGIPNTRTALLLKYIDENPSRIFETLMANPDVPFADSLIIVLAKRDPEKLYNYAQATSSKLGKRIQASTDPTTKLICSLANDNSGQLYFPFLDGLSKGKITIPEIKKVMNDSVAYFKLLVNTQIDYAGRAAQGDTAVAYNKLFTMLHNKAMPFINTINGLHEATPVVRFKILKPFSPKDLYYLIVVSESEIYTSSYTNIYDSIWRRMAVPSGDSLLAMVNNDHYKKFITMAANYNKLDHFLSKMNGDHATKLMRNFVNNLDKGKLGDLEDAVDVANAYSSINDKSIKKLMLDQIIENHEIAEANNNERGKTIYRLEKLILASSDSSSNINLSDSLGILPIYDVRNSFLKDSLGRIVLQMYFYGDEGGRGSFNVLKGMYSTWKNVSTSPEWIQLNSGNSATPFVIFANRPGYEEKNEDAVAQEHLNTWMQKNGYAPSITVHRGHSYYLKYTVEQMFPSSKVVVLGSCGAYHTMDGILSLCPEAYLIASKQTGFGQINNVLIKVMVEELKNGKDINWPAFWKLCQNMIIKERQDDFEDYIPPYKNLGAIFIKAYNKSFESAE